MYSTVMRSAAIALAATVLLAGCGAARSSQSESGPSLASIAPSEVSTRIIGGTPGQQRILREVLAGLGADELAEVEIIEPGPWGTGDPGSVALLVPHDPQDLRAEWQSWLLAQGFAERSQAEGLPPVSDVTGDRDGNYSTNLGPLPDVEKEKPTLAEAQIAAEKAQEAAPSVGAKVRRIEIVQPNGLGFLVELQIEGDPARFLLDGLAKVLEPIGGPDPFVESAFEGDYTVVLDHRGEVVWSGAEASLGDGTIQVGGATRWSLVGCGPYFRGGPPDRGPPPCPVE